MNSDIMKKLNDILYKMPKKDLVNNLNRAKEILKTSNKEDLEKLLNSKQVSDLIGSDKEKLQNSIKKGALNLKDIDEIKSFLEKKE